MRILLLLTIITLFSACENPAQPTFKKLENIKFNSLSIRKPYSVKLNADAIFNNPNTFGAQIKSADFDVIINGVKTTHIKQDISIKMPAHSDFMIPIICMVPLKDVFEDFKIKDLLSSQLIQYQMTGFLTIDLGGLPIKVPFDYNGEERLKL